MLSAEWVFLIVAGLLEPCWAVSLKKSDRFRNVPWAVATVLFLICSLYLLSVVMTSSIPVGTVYAVWVGIGAVGTLLAGIVVFKERTTALRMFFAVLIIIGVVGLQMTAGV